MSTMKKNIISLLGLAALTLISCNIELTEQTPNPVTDKETVTLSGFYPSIEAQTRIAISGNAAKWSSGDEITVFASSAKTPAKFKLTSGDGTTNGTFTGKLEGKADDDVYVLYPYLTDPFGSGIDPAPSEVKLHFNGQTQDGFGTNAEAHLGGYSYMASAPVKLSDGKADLSFSHLTVKMAFEFSLPEAATVKFLTIYASRDVFYDTGVVDLTAETPVAKGWGTKKKSFSMGFKNSKVAAGEKVTAYAMMLPTDLSSSSVTFYISAEKEDGKPVTYTVKKNKGLNFEAAKSYVADVPSLSKFNTAGLDMVLVPGGSMNICGIFKQDDDAANLATLNKDYRVESFLIGRTEITNQQYCDFLNARKPIEVVLNAWITDGLCQIENLGDEYSQEWVPKSGPILDADGKTTHVGSYADYPMIGVTGLGANAYSVYIAEKKLGYPSKDSGWYLPTEAQWEYAAVGSEWNESWAEEMIAGCRYDEDYNKYMWSCKNCDSEGSSCLGVYVGNGSDPGAVSGSGSLNGGTHPVAKLLPNYLGIYDMSGNVGEICSDYYNAEQYPYGSSLNPRNSNRANAYDTGDAGYARVVRGGMWFSIPDYGCTYVRDMMGQAASYNFTGFRMALPLK